jgi:hypothetical protein
MVSIQKKVLSKFFRDDTQATDSTLRGCRAKRAATKLLFQSDPVVRLKKRRSKRLFAR